MSFIPEEKICTTCPLSTKDLLGVYTGVLRCTVCHCIISGKKLLKSPCPRFGTVQEMEAHKELKKGS
jgi:hypothetical protein